MRILVTGSAGFIGFHVARRLLADGHAVVGLDGFTPYYDIALKRRRHDVLKRSADFTEVVLALEDAAAVGEAVAVAKADIVIHLAAQAGVRYSLENPRAYLEANLAGTFNLLEAVRAAPPRHLMIASTSSVYGANPATPFAETDRADHPLTLYAATKKAGEEMSHAYSHLWGLPTTVFRFFTVYGPWGRPDMALFRFAERLRRGEPLPVYDAGRPRRDFTYVDDLVEAISRLMAAPPVRGQRVGPRDSLSPQAPWRVVNIARGEPATVLDLVAALETALGQRARLDFKPAQQGDMAETHARSDLLVALTGYRPDTPLETGVRAFCDWLADYEAQFGPVPGA
ncbi:MAG: NAD-dependent epimerase/dehydratase family protein [Alphaproteobacteria bacterium]|nr:NAD-dependent epimerase/dehydratase family protein [Alphaproteobacteria bacterium]